MRLCPRRPLQDYPKSPPVRCASIFTVLPILPVKAASMSFSSTDGPWGPLTDANYYHLMLWPGHYHVNVHLPVETFLGQTKPAMDKSRSLILEPRLAGRTFLLIYEDGRGFRRMDGSPAEVAAVVGRRGLARAMTIEETAHVDRFLDTRYEGPSFGGQPHGKGTLLWEDGCRYIGIFNHGYMTEEGRFIFTDGTIYMGQLDKGRPKGRGALMAPDGRVLYAGPFEDEVPHGRGIRHGANGPEYCTFDHGVDITKSIRRLAEEALDEEEAAVAAQIAVADAWEIYPDRTETADPEQGAPSDKEQDPTEDQDPPEEQEDPRRRLDHFKKNRAWRTVQMRRTVAEAHQAALEKEASWCRDEEVLGRDWCTCAPFHNDTAQWRSCKR